MRIVRLRARRVVPRWSPTGCSAYSPAPLVLAASLAAVRVNDRATRSANYSGTLPAPLSGRHYGTRETGQFSRQDPPRRTAWCGSMIISSAEVGAGSGRGAWKLGNFKFCSHQSSRL